LPGAPALNLYGVLVLSRQSHHFFLADVRISLNLTGERSLLKKVSNPEKREVSRDKCLGSLFELLVFSNTLGFLVFYTRQAGTEKSTPQGGNKKSDRLSRVRH